MIAFPRFVRLLFILVLTIIPLLTGCDLPQVQAEDRLFLPLSVEFLDDYPLPKQEWEGTTVGGLSAIAYDRQRDRFYAVSDDRGYFGPSRFYTLKLTLDRTNANQPNIAGVEVESVTLFKDSNGDLYPADTLDPEGIALSSRNTVFVASEGLAQAGIPPSIDEFDLATGQWRQSLPIPERYLPSKSETEEPGERGIFNNLGFEALTVNPVGMASPMVEPFRLFVATESALAQDLDRSGSDLAIRNRFLHYLIGDNQVTLISEHLYPLSPDPLGTLLNGLSELVVLDQDGHFLGLERTFGLQGFDAKLYQLATGGATDTSAIASLKGDLSGLNPIRKRLLLDLADLDISLDNLEGMTLGPRLPDGSQSLLLISDDNFRDDQVTQLLLFRLRS